MKKTERILMASFPKNVCINRLHNSFLLLEVRLITGGWRPLPRLFFLCHCAKMEQLRSHSRYLSIFRIFAIRTSSSCRLPLLPELSPSLLVV